MAKDTRQEQKLALRGGLKAVSQIEGQGEPKIGIEEFMSVVDRFGLSEEARDEIRAIAEEEDWGEGPFLANYYSGLAESKVQAFERTACELFGSQHAIGTNSGTGALHAAFVAAGVGPGTEVICPAIGFFATAAAVVTAKGVPVFCDVDESLAIDPDKIEPLITERTVAIAPTHVMGSVCDMESVMDVARRHDLAVVEDCAQSAGGRFNGRYVGTHGDLGCFSISSYKIVGGGEGGLILTDEERLWERSNQIVECGGLWRPDRFAPPRYEGELYCGTNYRMSELEAAVDVVQLGKMEDAVERFRAVKRRITGQLKEYEEITPQKLNDPEGEVGYVLRFYPESVELAVRITEALEAEGIAASTRGDGASPDWHIYRYMYPVIQKGAPTAHRCPFECPVYTDRGGSIDYSPGDCPVAEDLFDRMVSVSLNQWFTDADCDRVVAGINKVLSAYCTETEAGTPWR